MRISDWSSDVCSSDLAGRTAFKQYRTNAVQARAKPDINKKQFGIHTICGKNLCTGNVITAVRRCGPSSDLSDGRTRLRSEEHTSELQSLMRISYAVFCLKKKKKYTELISDSNISYIINIHQ